MNNPRPCRCTCGEDRGGSLPWVWGDGPWGRLPQGGTILRGVRNRRKKYMDKGTKVPGVLWGRGEDNGAGGMQ